MRTSEERNFSMPHVATCHCGATSLEVPHIPDSATECTCTFCSKTGGLWVYYKPEEVTIVSESKGGIYSVTGYNKHHFCANCGCTTFGVSPDWQLGATEIPTTTKIAINARLFDDFDVGSLRVEKIDGRNLW
jgi:hypothetical protein